MLSALSPRSWVHRLFDRKPQTIRKVPSRPRRSFRPGLEQLKDRLAPATATWTGLGSTNDASEAANWSINAVPGSADILIFDGTSTKDALLDAAFVGTVSQIQVLSGYSGTVTLGRDLALGSSFTQDAGTFAAQSYTLTVTGSFMAGGGSFDAGTGTLWFKSTSGSSMTHTIELDGGSAGSLTLHNLVFADSGAGTKTYSIGTGDVLYVQGNFTMQASGGTPSLVANGGTIAVLGHVTVGTGANGGSTVIQFANTTADQTYASTGGILPTVELVNGTRTVSAASGTTDLAVRSLVLTGGAFTAPTGTLRITNDLVQTGGAFEAGTGTLLFNSSSGSSITHTVDVDGALTLNHLVFGDSGTGTKTYTLGTGDTLNVLGDFTMQRSGGTSTLVANGGTIAVQGNVTVGVGANGGTTVVQFANTGADQTYASTGGILPIIEIINGTRTVSAASGTTDLAARSLLLSSGTFAAPSGQLRLTHDLVQTGGAFEAGTGTLLFNNSSTSSTTHAIQVNGATGGLLNVHHLVFGDSGSSTKRPTPSAPATASSSPAT
jgi:hypothetical protein